MPSFARDDNDRASTNSDSNTDHEGGTHQDEKDEHEMEAAGANEEGNNDEEEEQEDSQYSFGGGGDVNGDLTPPDPSQTQSGCSGPSEHTVTSAKASAPTGPTSVPKSPTYGGSAPRTEDDNEDMKEGREGEEKGENGVRKDAFGYTYEVPKVRQEAIDAPVYDVVPTIAAPHSTSINAVAATPDLKWVFSGGADGFIRRYNWIETANGKSLLTVAQRHPFVDSVTKAGVLMNYWENNEDASGKTGEDSSSVSPVYSLATQHEGMWLLSGLESGGINLQSVRVEEGKQIACLRSHSSAVSVLTLSHDEQTVLSGSWDKTVLDWDLNTGQVIRSFEGSAGQISAIEHRPLSSLAVPPTFDFVQEEEPTFTSNGAAPSRADGLAADPSDLSKETNGVAMGAPNSPADSLFDDGGALDDTDGLFGESEIADAGPSAGNFGDEDEDFSKAMANAVGDQPVPEKDLDISNLNADVDMTLFNDDSNTAMEIDGVPANKDVKDEDFSTAMAVNGQDTAESGEKPNGLPHSDEVPSFEDLLKDDNPPPAERPLTADTVFLAASIDGSIRIWDKRQPDPVAKMMPRNAPPWCMNATWSPDGDFIFAGRRNGTVDEYSLHQGLQNASRSFKLPNNSGAVSAVRAMPNGRHLLCASFDIIRLYDLQQKQIFKHATVPFLIVPGHRTGVVSQLFIDPACRYMISIAGNRGWEGTNTEVLLGYEINVPP